MAIVLAIYTILHVKWDTPLNQLDASEVKVNAFRIKICSLHIKLESFMLCLQGDWNNFRSRKMLHKSLWNFLVHLLEWKCENGIYLFINSDFWRQTMKRTKVWLVTMVCDESLKRSLWKKLRKKNANGPSAPMSLCRTCDLLQRKREAPLFHLRLENLASDVTLCCSFSSLLED